ncbi:hypothetical protein [Kitasatospora sp. NBC_01266]|uniref:hypothetical protein n=1 Tax=Kitasatospora sp. NBC_01266 TaxID=2903572 RepID=UPI002E31E194|nr:hypothetical protein [Kitasatospora sp. NBC_01266]
MSIVALAGLSILLVAGCGSTSTSTPAKGAQAAPANGAAAGGGTAAKPSGVPGDGIGGSGTITLSAGSTYHFTTVACLGEKSPSGKLTMSGTADDGSGTGPAVVIGFDGAGQFSLTMTVPDATAPKVWSGQSAVGAAASRTADTVKFTDLPITEMTGGAAKATGTLKCSGTQALS